MTVDLADLKARAAFVKDDYVSLPGSQLLALIEELEAARAVVEAARKMTEDGHPNAEDWFRIITRRLDAYDDRVRGADRD